MMNSYAFCDLNIPVQQPNLKQTVIQALKLGYRTIAITRMVVDENLQPSKKKKKGQNQPPEIPPPFKFDISQTELKRNGISKEPIFLSRLTIIYSQPGSPFLHKNKEILSEYDLIAFTPTTDAAFKQVCVSNKDADIISLNIDDMNYKPSRKLIQLAIKRDVYFEISYGPSIRNPKLRQRTIQLAHTLHQVSRSVNVIMTSNAQGREELRGPYDVANLGFLFALTQAASKEAILSTSWATIYCAQKRRMAGNKCSAEIVLLDEKEAKRAKFSSLLEIDKLIQQKFEDKS